MTDTPSAPRTTGRRLVVVRVAIVLAVLLAIAMGIGLARQMPPPENPDEAASR